MTEHQQYKESFRARPLLPKGACQPQVAVLSGAVAGRIFSISPQDPPPYPFKIHSEPAIAALHQRRDRQHRLWTLARWLDRRGVGRFRRSEFLEQMKHLGLRGLSPGTTRRLLRDGEGVFWNTHRYRDGVSWLHLRSLERVCISLGVDKLRRDPVLAPFDMITTLKRYRAVVFASMFPDDKFSNPISRATLERITGYTGQGQRGWQAMVGARMEHRSNAALTGKEWKRGEKLPQGHYVGFVDEELAVLHKLPNAYRCGLQCARRGMIRETNKRLHVGNSLRISGREEHRHAHLFYDDPKAALRRLQARTEGDELYLVGSRGDDTNARDGTLLWLRASVTDGGILFS